jgi:type I restriction enzyme, R subunit
LFSDAEWDGEPIEPEPNVPKKPKEPEDEEGGGTGEGTGGGEGGDGEPTVKKIKIKLSDGKAREIQSMRSTMFYVDGTPTSAEDFLQRLFNTLKLPELFGTEDTLRKQWANPNTRSELLKKLEQQGCGKSDLLKLQKMIDADNCDLLDVLEYISYARKPITRAERVSNAQSNIYTVLNEKQRDFIDFVLKNYVQDGVDELDLKRLSSILASKYGSSYEGQKVLGSIAEIQSVFVGFQQHLYNVYIPLAFQETTLSLRISA